MMAFYALLIPFLYLSSLRSAHAQVANPFTWNGVRYDCKCSDLDACWPQAAAWSALNASVGGNLQKVVPDPAVCYNTFEGVATYNQQACSDVTRNFNGQDWQSDRAVSNHWMLWTNNTCLPTTNRNAECTLGFLPRYVIMAKTREHIKAGIDFARTNNVRLIIRNTGHDFMGRSTGYSALAINTHSFKNVTFIPKYTGPGGWTGSAVTVGAGIQGRELLRLANQQSPKVAIVTGECPTVGFAGGYIQGGGHGPLASYYGMAADQALSYEVITASGEYLTANADTNPDLYWGLRGGGPSTFAVLLSVTVKTFPETPSAGLVLSLNTNNNQDLFWRGFAAFHNLSPRWVENGMFVYYELFGASLNIRPFVGVNMTRTKITEVVQPLFDQLRTLGITYTSTITEYTTFFDLYTALFQDESAGVTSLVGGRVFTKTDINANGNAIVDAMRRSGAGFVGHIVGPGRAGPVDNAIHPAWRDAASFSISSVNLAAQATWAQKQQAQTQLTNSVDAPLRAASPNGAAYVNEGNLEEPDWQKAYWGSNYPRLLELRKKWDPNGVFYARTTPGTEAWEVVDYGRRLCRLASAGGTTTTSTTSTSSTSTTSTVTTPTTTTSTPAGPLQTMYGQCGGTGWTGPTECAPPATCKPVSTPYYSQCQP
ncbi:hypothetical protein D9611_013341 [Ephemerocybe angulata]|uniref:Uncharacterized protein n=1 Tax=Ephemerocybe angulata TaxID=980116 RepID=A0A8H5CC35_9AGAR|nr:hypothetical protein D9611_013341 [Tulosesus angulatus]